jgi:hypothetical protein
VAGQGVPNLRARSMTRQTASNFISNTGGCKVRLDELVIVLTASLFRVFMSSRSNRILHVSANGVVSQVFNAVVQGIRIGVAHIEATGAWPKESFSDKTVNVPLPRRPKSVMQTHLPIGSRLGYVPFEHSSRYGTLPRRHAAHSTDIGYLVNTFEADNRTPFFHLRQIHSKWKYTTGSRDARACCRWSR